jgi:4-diphosphocytidyl-2-C-methyl-D-erythritol kinase
LSLDELAGWDWRWERMCRFLFMEIPPGGRVAGELLSAVMRPERWFLVIHPGVAVSTASMFQAPELTRNSPSSQYAPFRKAAPPMRSSRSSARATLKWRRRWTGCAHRSTRTTAPIAARMTGTGACIFASFERAAEAERIAARVPDRWNSFVARGLNRSPLHAMLGLEWLIGNRWGVAKW